MVSRRKILSRSRDELHSDIYYMAENDDDDVWYNKEKLYAVRVRKQSYRCTERCNLAMFLYNLNDIANGASFCIIMRYYSLRSQCEIYFN